MEKINLIPIADQIDWDNLVLSDSMHNQESFERFYDKAQIVFKDNVCIKGGHVNIKEFKKDGFNLLKSIKLQPILTAKVGDTAYFNENGFHKIDGPAYISKGGETEVWFLNGIKTKVKENFDVLADEDYELTIAYIM